MCCLLFSRSTKGTLGGLDKSLDSLFGRASCFFDQSNKLRKFRAVKYRVHDCWLIVAQYQALKILMPAERPAFSNALSRVASGTPRRTATSRYAASYAERLYSRASGRTLLTVSATVCECSIIVSPPSSSTKRRKSGRFTRLRRSATRTAFVISSAHTAGTITIRPSSATSTPSAYSLASSAKHQASATEASTTIPVKIAALR